MSFDAHKNFCKVLVSGLYNASATSVILASAEGAKLPVSPFNLTWWDATTFSDPSDDPKVEIIRVTAITSDTLTITRGQEGTSASTKSTASSQYEMILAVTAKTLTDIESDSGGGVVQNLRAASATISSPLDPADFVFVERGQYRPTGLINQDFVMGRMLWNTDPTGFLSQVNGTKGTDWDIVNGYLEIEGSNSVFTAFETNTVFEAPYYAIEMPVISVISVGVESIVTLGLHNGPGGTSHASVQMRWHNSASKIGVYTVAVDSTVTALGEVDFTPPTAPFKLAMTYACRSVTVQLQQGTGNYVTIARGIVPADGIFDLRLPTNSAAYKYLSLQSVQAGNTGSKMVLGNITYGYLAGINGLADKTVKFMDGTPVQHGNSHYLINSLQHIAASSAEGAPTANFTIQECDPSRNYLKTVAMVFVVRTVNGVQHIEGENSGVCAYNPDTDEFIYLIPNWGDYRTGSTYGPINIYVYRRTGFPKGIIVLSGGQIFTGLPTSTSDYDPDLYDDGTLVHMVYTRTNTTQNWTQFSTVHSTTPRATFGPGCTWTQVAIQALSGSNEGAKFFKVGGVRYIICTDNINHVQVVLDFNLNQLTTFAVPTGTPQADGHACMINYREAATDRIFWLYFDNAKYDGFTGTWGAIHFLENLVRQVGHDFAERTLLDIGG